MLSYNPSSHQFTGIDPDWIARCRDAYPHVNMDKAMKQAALWLDADWPKRKKIKWERFLLNWFSKAEQDALVQDRNTKTQTGLAPPLKRPKLEELVPRGEVRDFISKLSEMSVQCRGGSEAMSLLCVRQKASAMIIE